MSELVTSATGPGGGDESSDDDGPDVSSRSPESVEASGFSAAGLTGNGRVRKWDRPPPPHDWRWYVGNVGKILIAVGLLMFGFVGYQLYGTGIETAAAQHALENEFESLLAQSAPNDAATAGDAPSTPAADTPGSSTPTAETDEPVTPTGESGSADESGTMGAAVPVDEQNLPNFEHGDALARIEIPRIGVDDIVVAGVDTSDLKKGPGHFPNTPMPGQLGNAAIAGHRTTYGQPFRNVDQLANGDEIRVTTLTGVYVYRVTGQRIVRPSDYEVVATTDPTTANLTLTSCHPVFTARERIVIFSELVSAESAPVGEPVLDYGRPPPASQTATEIPGDAESTTPDGSTAPDPVDNAAPDVTAVGDPTVDAPSAVDDLGSDAVNTRIADAFSEGWFSDPGANSQVGLWGLVLSVIALGGWGLSRRLRRDWAGLAIGILPFVVALYFFFQNVNRLLPPNL